MGYVESFLFGERGDRVERFCYAGVSLLTAASSVAWFALALTRDKEILPLVLCGAFTAAVSAICFRQSLKAHHKLLDKKRLNSLSGDSSVGVSSEI